MKNKNILFVLVILMAIVNRSLYALSDDAVVDSIKAYSNLTQADVDKWKFLWLGSLAEPAATAVTGYGMYKVGTKGYELASRHSELIKNVFQNAYMPHFLKSYEPSDKVQGWMTGKWIWAGVGVTGVGLAAYKALYPRVQAGIKDKIQNYVALCSRLAVTKQKYNNIQGLQNALQAPGNTVWIVSNPIAQELGFINLIEQANVALLLIDQLQASGEYQLDGLRTKALTFKSNAEHNKELIVSLVQRELQKRSLEQGRYGKQLEIEKKEVDISGQKIKNITNQWVLLKDIGKTAQKYGPSILTGLGAFAAYSKITDWLYPQPVPQKIGE